MKAQLSGITTHFPSFPRTKKHSPRLGAAVLAALLAAGSAQAQVTDVSIVHFFSVNDCASTAQLDYHIDAASPGYGEATIEVAQGGKTGTYAWSRSYPGSGGIGLSTLTGSLTSWADVDKSQPFTVTFSFNDGANTESATIGVGKCSYPSSTLVPTYTANDASGASGSVSCTPNPVAEGDTTICTATANPGYIYNDGSIKLDSGTASDACSGDTCTLSNVQSNVSVSATFKAIGGGGGNATAVPTLGEGALLLSSLALAGAAAPALRRREKQGKKSDTCH